MKKYLALILLLSLAAAFAACGDEPQKDPAANGTVGPVVSNPNDTPTLAYKRLFAAVKSKNIEAIKAEFSKASIATAQSQAAKSNVPVEEVYKNGFTATTFSETLPEIRDERIKGSMGAVEVWNSRDKTWEDLPFVREESGWKLAVGDVFAGTWKRPALGRAAREMQAANASSNNGMVNVGPNPDFNKLVNGNANINRISNANRTVNGRP